MTTTPQAFVLQHEDRTLSDLIVDENASGVITDITDSLKITTFSSQGMWLCGLIIDVYNSSGETPILHRLKRADRKLIRQDADAAAAQFGYDLVIFDLTERSFTVHIANGVNQKEAA